MREELNQEFEQELRRYGFTLPGNQWKLEVGGEVITVFEDDNENFVIKFGAFQDSTFHPFNALKWPYAWGSPEFAEKIRPQVIADNDFEALVSAGFTTDPGNRCRWEKKIRGVPVTITFRGDLEHRIWLTHSVLPMETAGSVEELLRKVYSNTDKMQREWEQRCRNRTKEAQEAIEHAKRELVSLKAELVEFERARFEPRPSRYLGYIDPSEVKGPECFADACDWMEANGFEPLGEHRGWSRWSKTVSNRAGYRVLELRRFNDAPGLTSLLWEAKLSGFKRKVEPSWTILGAISALYDTFYLKPKGYGGELDAWMISPEDVSVLESAGFKRSVPGLSLAWESEHGDPVFLYREPSGTYETCVGAMTWKTVVDDHEEVHGDLPLSDVIKRIIEPRATRE